ncbi:MAG: D-alanine--D-alanine ligase [Ignavibacteriae bacterium HGW-Ignavibacteriae-3]|nr:MAG: D-alanine--D-alanine ligase [Ignavibacteriae bacterium HGW-Ignavibacteriae-3]
MNLEQKILICYNEPTRYYDNYLGKGVSDSDSNVDLSEREFLKQIEMIKKSLSKKYMSVEALAVNSDIKSAMKKISHFSPDIIFNFVETVEGNSNFESFIAGMFDLLEIPFTGNGAITLGNCLVKSRTKQILQAHGIRTPKHLIAEINAFPEFENFHLKFPVILKLAREDASIGISEFSVVQNFTAMNERLDYLFKSFNQEVIIEEYIDGRELNVAILGEKVLPISEIRFDGLPDEFPKIVTYEAKWSPESVYFKNTVPRCPAPLDDQLRQKIEKMALEAFEALECRDYVRVDIRLNQRNVPYVIEVNPNPDISPDTGFVRSAAAAGIGYDELLFKISTFALKRITYDTQAAS